jgi:integrase
MGRSGSLPSNIMERGSSFVVHMKGMRPDGGLYWRQFSFAAYGGKEGAEAAARLDLARLHEKRARGQRMPQQVQATFREAAEAWFENGCTTRNWKLSTAQDYRSALDSRLLRRFGDLPLSQITEGVVAAWLTDARVDGLSPRMLQKLLTIMVGVFKHARRKYGFPGNPALEVERIKQAGRPELQVYEPDEIWALVRAAEDDQDAAIYLTAAFAGLRLGEFPPLTVKDIDFARSTIRVEASVTRGVKSVPKSGKGRAVPMVDEIATALAKVLTTRGNPGRNELVFPPLPGESGEYMNTNKLRDRYVAARDRAGLRPLTFHQQRHSFGSVAIDKLSAVEVQQAMGHASLQTTQRYLHFRDSSEVAKRLQGAFAITRTEPVESVTDEQVEKVIVLATGAQLHKALRLRAKEVVV